MKDSIVDRQSCVKEECALVQKVFVRRMMLEIRVKSLV